jgi:hypothetical protein
LLRSFLVVFSAISSPDSRISYLSWEYLRIWGKSPKKFYD